MNTTSKLISGLVLTMWLWVPLLNTIRWALARMEDPMANWVPDDYFILLALVGLSVAGCCWVALSHLLHTDTGSGTRSE